MEQEWGAGVIQQLHLCRITGAAGAGKGMAKFSDIKTLEKFAPVHASIHNHPNLVRHLNHLETFKQD